jgi:hypothetical protein
MYNMPLTIYDRETVSIYFVQFVDKIGYPSTYMLYGVHVAQRELSADASCIFAVILFDITIIRAWYLYSFSLFLPSVSRVELGYTSWREREWGDSRKTTAKNTPGLFLCIPLRNVHLYSTRRFNFVLATRWGLQYVKETITYAIYNRRSTFKCFLLYFYFFVKEAKVGWDNSLVGKLYPLLTI